MLLPGVSGGTCAIILGIYDRLISSVSEITKRINIKQNLLFLLQVLLGGAVGAVLFSFLLSSALEVWSFYLSYLFIGAVLGTVPIIVKQSEISVIKPTDILFAGAGVVASIGITLIPKNLLQLQQITTVGDFFMLFAAGFFVSIALILPGISVSYTLLILGIYERILTAVKTSDALYILPIALGCIIGIFTVTSCLDYLMNRYKRNMYMIILGFVISCIPQVFEGIPKPGELIICTALLAGGFIIIFKVSKAAKSVKS